MPSTDGAPILSLPSLPIGGDAETASDDPARQCVHVSWIVTTAANPVISPGYAVEVRGATFSAKGFQVVQGGCTTSQSSRPNCIGSLLRTGKDRCDLGIRALPGADPNDSVEVRLTGILYCPKSVGMARCQRFAAAVAQEPGVSIALNPAPEPPTTDTSTDAAIGR